MKIPLREALHRMVQGLKKIKLKNIIYLLLLGFIFFELLIVFPKKLDTSEEEEVQPIQEDETSGQQKMAGVHLVESTKGLRDWELFANAAEGYQSKGTWLLKNVKVLFYASEKMTFTVTGAVGSIDALSKDMKISGQVKTVSSNGYTFETDLVEYKSSARMISSPCFVKVQGPEDQMGEGMVLTGVRFMADVSKSLMSLQSNVQGRKKLKDGNLFSIRSERVEMSGSSKEAHFFENVKIEYGAMRMESAEALFKYSKDNKLMNQLSLMKDVQVLYGDKRATSQRLDLDLLQNKFVFTGKPKLMQNEDEISGDSIVFLEGGKRVKVEKLKPVVTEK